MWELLERWEESHKLVLHSKRYCCKFCIFTRILFNNFIMIVNTCAKEKYKYLQSLALKKWKLKINWKIYYKSNQNTNLQFKFVNFTIQFKRASIHTLSLCVSVFAEGTNYSFYRLLNSNCLRGSKVDTNDSKAEWRVLSSPTLFSFFVWVSYLKL